MREFRKFVASRSMVSNELVKSHMKNDSCGLGLSASARRILREGA